MKYDYIELYFYAYNFDSHEKVLIFILQGSNKTV